MLRRISSTVARNAFQKIAFSNSKQFLAPIVSASHIPNSQQVNIQKRFTSKAAKGQTVAVVMTGAGFLDGTEITEAVSLMIHLSDKGYVPTFFSPDGEIQEVFDHHTRALEKNEVRNVFSEVARITRVKTISIKQLQAKAFDSLYIPGGFGAAKMLCNFAEDPKEFTVDPDLTRIVKEFYAENKPIGAMCIAPVILGRILGKNAGGPGITVTLGGDSAAEEAVKNWGNEVVNIKATEATVDTKNRIVTTPAYMLKNPSSFEVFTGIGELVNEMTNLSRTRSSSSSTIDWDFQDYYYLKILKIAPEEWAFLKKEMQQKAEDEAKKANERG